MFNFFVFLVFNVLIICNVKGNEVYIVVYIVKIVNKIELGFRLILNLLFE